MHIQTCIYSPFSLSFVSCPLSSPMEASLNEKGFTTFFTATCYSVVRKSMIDLAVPLLMGIWVLPNICCYKLCCVNYLTQHLHRT